MAIFQRAHRNDQLIQVTRQQPTTSLGNDGFVKLIIGLGNIGKDYENTRHNVGFMVIDQFANNYDFPKWQEKTKLRAYTAESFLDGQKIILAKPTTLMNLSGGAVRLLKDFYKLDNAAITVVHDELDLPFGTVKQKTGGGSAGQNGIKNVIATIGEDFNRLRFGVGPKVPEQIDSADFVLSSFTKSEQARLQSLLNDAAVALR